MKEKISIDELLLILERQTVIRISLYKHIRIGEQ